MKVAKEELTDLKSEFNSNMKDTLRKLEQVQNKINHIQKMNSFQGETADTAKEYFRSVHGKIVTELQSTIGLLQTNLNDIHSEFTQSVDQSQTAILTEDHLNETDKKVLSIEKNLMTTHDKGEQTVREVSDLVSVYMPSIASVETSIRNSSKYIKNVNEDLYNYDRNALKKVNESREKVKILNTKLNNYVKISLKQNSMKDLDLNDYEVKGTKDADTSGSSFLYMIAGYKSFKKFNKHINDTNKFMTAGLQFYIYSKLNKMDRKVIRKTGQHAMTKAQYIKFNNILSSSIYKFNGKKLMEFVGTHKLDVLKKEKFKMMMDYIKPYGHNRGKLASIRGFDELFDLNRYREFKKLGFSEKTIKVVTTFGDEFAGKKYKATKKAIDFLPEWKKPKLAYKKVVENFHEANKGLNKLGKSMKVLGKTMGIAGVVVMAADNYAKYKDDTQKVVVGTAVDTVITSGATAAGAAVGSAFFPPIGTVVGAGVGMGISYLANRKVGSPPKSATEITKDLVDKGVDSTVKAAKNIGSKISKWFK